MNIQVNPVTYEYNVSGATVPNCGGKILRLIT